jgi:hypothetical protein
MKIDMSAHAVTMRLKKTSELRSLCIALGCERLRGNMRSSRFSAAGDKPNRESALVEDRLVGTSQNRLDRHDESDYTHHGRTASYPAAPVQIPACGTTAPGSSKLLASHTAALC